MGVFFLKVGRLENSHTQNLNRPAEWQNSLSTFPLTAQQLLQSSRKEGTVFLSQQWEEGYIGTELRLKTWVLNLESFTSNIRNIY